MPYPISEQLERGREAFGAMLSNTPIGIVPQGHRDTLPLELEQPWGPFTFVTVRSEIAPLDYRGTNKPQTLRPFIKIELKMGEEGEVEMGIGSSVNYRQLDTVPEDISDDYSSARIDSNRLVPDRLTFHFGDTMPGHVGSTWLGVVRLGSNQENMPLADSAANLLKVSLDVVTAIGSTGIVESLIPAIHQPKYHTPVEADESQKTGTLAQSIIG